MPRMAKGGITMIIECRETHVIVIGLKLTCSPEECVTEINLYNNGLIGHIPPKLPKHHNF